MKNKKEKHPKNKYHVYQSPLLFSGLFYILLVLWTIVCVFFIGSKAIKVGWPLGQLMMIAFVLAYTWYFSLGISYKVTVDSEGNIELTSFRRKINVNAKYIEMAEGPRFAIVPFGFLRFRLAREKAYLFIVITDQVLLDLLTAVRRTNPEMKFKGLPIGKSHKSE